MAWIGCTHYVPKQSHSCKFPKIDAINSELTEEEYRYLKMILAIPVFSILDEGQGQKACKKLGQRIFDEYKGSADGCSFHGKAGAMKICNAIARYGVGFGGDPLRKQFVAYAWEGIGDTNWRWYFDPSTWIRDEDFRSDY